MARYIKLLVFISIFLLGSCQEGSEAGTLFGMWRMDGSSGLYLSISGNIVMFRGADKVEVYGNYNQRNDSLFIQCYSIRENRNDTNLVTQQFSMPSFSDIRLKIEENSSDRLTLSSNKSVWYFHKY